MSDDPQDPTEPPTGKAGTPGSGALEGEALKEPAEEGSAGKEPPKATAGARRRPDRRRRMRRLVALAVPVLMITAVVLVLRRSDAPAPAGNDRLVNYCATLTERDSIALPVAVPEPSEELRNSVAVTAGRLILLTERMLETAPDDAKEPLEAQVAAYRELVRTRDPAGFKSERLLEARREASTVESEACGVNQVDFTASEYRYNGVPQTMRHGKVSFQMRNEGEEAHQMTLYRRNADSEGEFPTILEAGTQDEEATAITTMHVAAGATYAATADVAGGRYAMVCVLTTGDQPHWQRGMIAEFEVQ
ncbi:MAG TPA: hypothetical protein VHJ78_11735 [Actinomycetota bacterium]|nr:hypothetical protein [Actinomycetota bacterium]